MLEPIMESNKNKYEILRVCLRLLVLTLKTPTRSLLSTGLCKISLSSKTCEFITH